MSKHQRSRKGKRRKLWKYNQERDLRLKYGITPEEYGQMVLKQGGRCAICNRVPRNKLVIDHDHEIKKIRGLLCPSCNLGLGWLTRAGWNDRAKTYLEGIK